MDNLSMKQNKPKERLDDSLFIKTEFSSDGMNTETNELLSILIEKTEDDTNISSGNLGEVSRYLSGILPDKICGMVMVCVLLIHMEIS